MTKSFKPKAIIFDYDGTLADTESLCAYFHPILYKKYGYSLSPEQALKLRSAGHPLREQLLVSWFNPKNPKKLLTEIEEQLLELIDNYDLNYGIKQKQDCEDVLLYLSNKKIPMYVATSSNKDRVESQLKSLKIDKYITKVFSATNLKHGKPYPDIYLFVCKELGLDPGECLAIEDCPNGIVSACTAGCKTIMIPDLSQPTNELLKKYKFKVLSSLKDLKKIL